MAHRIGSLLYAPDAQLRDMGVRELRAALAAEKSVQDVAITLGVPERTLYRWIDYAALAYAAPDGRKADVSDAEVRRVVRKAASLKEASQALGLSMTTVFARARNLGLVVADGRRKS